MNITSLASKISNGKWLLSPLDYSILVKRVEGYIKNPTTITKKTEATTSNNNSTVENDPRGYTAIIPISGILIKGADPEACEELGLCNVDMITKMLDKCVEDSSVKDICLSFASPGGETTGIEELGRKIAFINSNIKPIKGWVEFKAASAAYWLLSQCGLIGMTPSAEVGSVGVYTLIEDCTKQMEQEGIKIEAFSAGKYKLTGHSFRSLTDEEKKILQDDVEETNLQFKGVVTSTRKINDEYLQGLSFNGKKALTYGFVDILADTCDEFLTNSDITK
jgi:signal peptide peptidase SppA